MQRYFPIGVSEAVFLPVETVPNSQKTNKVIQIVDPEFSSVCPKTGLPDYGRVILRYIPHEHCVELKAWKLFLRCFYGVGMFHEDCTQRIADAFNNAVDPQWSNITIDWGARGGLHTATQLTWTGGNYVSDLQDFSNEVFVKHAKCWHNS